MNKIAIFYGSDSGNTEAAATELAQKLDADVYDVSNTSIDKITEYSTLIFGTSTMGIGDLQYDWEDFLESLDKADLTGKTVALFGLGDADSYPDSFVDGMGTIYDTIVNKGCKVIGHVATDEYDFDESTAVVDGKFVGLPLDNDNEDNLTESRIDSWVKQLKSEMN